MNKVKIFFLVDDDVDDHEFFKDALKEVDSTIEFVTAVNGDEALQKLKGWIGPLPDYIILDLNLPGMSGKKCLVEIKKNKAFNHIPVVMYSTRLKKNHRRN